MLWFFHSDSFCLVGGIVSSCAGTGYCDRIGVLLPGRLTPYFAIALASRVARRENLCGGAGSSLPPRVRPEPVGLRTPGGVPSGAAAAASVSLGMLRLGFAPVRCEGLLRFYPWRGEAEEFTSDGPAFTDADSGKCFAEIVANNVVYSFIPGAAGGQW